MKKRFNIPANGLYDDYIVKKMTVKELMAKYGCGRKAITSRLSEYGIMKRSPAIGTLTYDDLYQRYIIDNRTAQSIADEFGTTRQYIMSCIGSFGISKPKDAIDATKKKTYAERTGYDHPMHNPAAMQRQRAALTKHYGVDNPMKCDELREKAKSTMLGKYGVENIAQLDSIKKKYVSSARSTMIERYGVEWACQLPQCSSAIGAKGRHTKPNDDFAARLDTAGIEYVREFPVGTMAYDFKVGDKLIEIDPSATHNADWSPFGSGVGIDYHLRKSENAAEHGFRCIHVFDWDDPDKIISMILPRKTIYARKCEVRCTPADESASFLGAHHIQGSARFDIAIGLYHDDELVSVMTFGKPRYSAKYEYEIIRYCASANVIGGAKRLLSHFMSEYGPNSIISYCDSSKFRGKTYSDLGFERHASKGPSLHWYNIKTKQHITNSLLLQRGFDQLFGTDYGKGTDNAELMKNSGFVRIYDCGQDSYVWRKPK